MLKMQYIYYIDVKSNEQRQQEVAGLTSLCQRDIPVPWPVLLCRGSCFFSYTAENNHHLTAKIISKLALC
jgi:hypothetical protein